jgi:glycosyltransferase involved in cell wall biosynthesis
MAIRFLYLANARIPTEKAHGLQIMQNCEAFADAGAQVELWAARRFNTPEMNAVTDEWAFYGVKQNFTLRRIPCLDLMPLVATRTDYWARLAFYIQEMTYLLMLILHALFTHADVYYSRDPLTMLALSFFKPRHKLAYEPHSLSPSRAGKWLQRIVIRRVGTVFPVTNKLRDDLVELFSSPRRGVELNSPTNTRFLVVHDGIRRERFAHPPAQADARQKLGWPQDAFIVGYMGRLQTMAMDKGVGTLISAMAQLEVVSLGLVGGPDEAAMEFRAQWRELGLDETRFLYAGQVSPERVPLYLSAFDICTMPFPWTTHFAYYASPIKLFEYMAARRAIVASDLPSTAEVVKHEESALLVLPGDVQTLAAAIRRLREDSALRERLAANAYQLVMARYTWEARAQAILEKIRKSTEESTSS